MDKSRLGLCYELAGQRVLKDGAERILVHGRIERDGHGVDHAWVEEPGPTTEFAGKQYEWTLVWEPASEWEGPKEAFEYLFGAAEHCRYTREEMMVQMCRTKHWGPWKEA